MLRLIHISDLPVTTKQLKVSMQNRGHTVTGLTGNLADLKGRLNSIKLNEVKKSSFLQVSCSLKKKIELPGIDNVVVKQSGKPTFDFYSGKAEDVIECSWGRSQFDTDLEGLV
jgi:hypothetical protein